MAVLVIDEASKTQTQLAQALGMDKWKLRGLLLRTGVVGQSIGRVVFYSPQQELYLRHVLDQEQTAA
jgi:hypothetical protein